MPMVLVRHKVAHYAKWKRVVRRFAGFRKVSGEKCFKVFRAGNSPNDLTVLCRWSAPAKMKKFIKSAEPRTVMKKAGVISKPAARFFRAVEDLSVGGKQPGGCQYRVHALRFALSRQRGLAGVVRKHRRE